MNADTVNAWFDPFHFWTYLGVILVGLIFFEQHRWTRKVLRFIKVIVIHSDGSSDIAYVAKAGPYIQIKDIKSNTTRLWPVSEISTFDTPYPDADFVPNFLKKKIRTTIVNEDDWEPMVNRNPSQGVIANPAWLGSMTVQRVAEAFAIANEEVKEVLNKVIGRMHAVVTPQTFYIGTGMVLAALIFAIYSAMPVIDQFSQTTEQVQQLSADVLAIKQALGVK